MGRKLSGRTRKKISEGVKRARQQKKDEQQKQALVDKIMANFEKGAGKKATKLYKVESRREYEQVGDGEEPKKEGVEAAVEIRSHKTKLVDGDFPSRR